MIYSSIVVGSRQTLSALILVSVFLGCHNKVPYTGARYGGTHHNPSYKRNIDRKIKVRGHPQAQGTRPYLKNN
jgi:hypothetical protein